MPTAALIRRQIEDALADRIPSALTPAPRTIRELFTTGIKEVDEICGGGFPLGAITEIIGQESSGRTSLALSYLGQITADGRACSWIDTSDAFDPESAAANGIELSRLLWIRCDDSCKSSRQQVDIATKKSVTPDYKHGARQQEVAGGSHPRSEVRGMSRAIEELFKTSQNNGFQQNPITPGVSNVNFRRVARNEQTSSDRDQRRRNELLTHHPAALMPSVAYRSKSNGRHISSSDTSIEGQPPTNYKPYLWNRLEQAIRATDLLLQGGGFSAIVLDLCNVPIKYAARIPLATWYRFRVAAEHSRTSLLLLAPYEYARSCSSLSLSLKTVEAHGRTIIEEMVYHGTCKRGRFNTLSQDLDGKRKAPHSTWSERMYWARNK